MARNLFKCDNDKNFGIAVFRGLEKEVDVAIEFARSKGASPKKKSTEHDGIFEFKIGNFDFNSMQESAVETILNSFPLLKMVAFTEDFYNQEVHIAYSPSGSPNVTALKFVGGFEPEDDPSYHWQHLPTEHQFDETVTYNSTGESDDIYYEFPFEREWNMVNYSSENGDLCGDDNLENSVFEYDNVDFINFKDRVFVLTGFSEKEKAKITQIIESKGGKVGKNCTSATSYLIAYSKYDHQTQKYYDAKHVQDQSWHSAYVAVIDEAAFYRHAELPSGQVREGGSFVRIVDGMLVDVSHTITDLEVKDGSIKDISTTALQGLEHLHSVTTDGNVLLDLRKCVVEKAIIVNPQYIKWFGEHNLSAVDMPVVSLTKFEERMLKECAVKNFVKKMEQGKEISSQLEEEYNSYIQRNRKKLYEQKEISVLRYMAQKGLIPPKEANVLFNREDLQLDDELKAALSAVSTVHKKSSTDSPDRYWLKKRDRNSRIARLYKGLDTEIIVPAMIKGEPIDVLGDLALSPLAEGLTEEQISARKQLKKVVISEGIEQIHWSAFRGCGALEELVLPESLVYINIDTLSDSDKDCYQIYQSIKNVTRREKAFSANYAFQCSIIPDGVLEIPEGVEVIGYDAFFGCEDLKQVSFPSSLKHISEKAFDSCDNLEEVVLPDGLISIGDHAFADCWSLKKISIPASVSFIGSKTFLASMFAQKNEDLVAYVKPGSYAESRMKELGYPTATY